METNFPKMQFPPVQETSLPQDILGESMKINSKIHESLQRLMGMNWYYGTMRHQI